MPLHPPAPEIVRLGWIAIHRLRPQIGAPFATLAVVTHCRAAAYTFVRVAGFQLIAAIAVYFYKPLQLRMTSCAVVCAAHT